jgi:hypothetical protein
MKRRVIVWGLLLAAAAAAAAPYLPAGVFRGRIERALERGLGRKVEIGGVRFTFFPGPLPGPGFTLAGVAIHEDPRAGIEPFAYIGDAGASLNLLALARGHFAFSRLNLEDATVNLVKTDAGPWNFQFLLEHLRGQDAAMPVIRMRGGRVNFKFGDTKSVFFFNDADLDVSHTATGALDLRFGGAPSRNDRPGQDFGRFFVTGTSWAGQGELDFRVELQRSSLEQTLRLIDPAGFGVHGLVALNARLSGRPEALRVEGRAEVGDIHRWDLLPREGGGWQLAFHGLLDLPGERLELESGPDQPAVVRFRAWDYLQAPKWEAGADFRAMPLATLFEVGRHMGAALPEQLAVDGAVSGSAAYDQQNGVRGSFTLSDASLTLPDQEPLRAAEARVEIGGGAVQLEPTVVQIGEQSAEVRGSYSLAAPRALDLRIATRGLSVAAMRSFGLAAIPVIEQTPQGTWQGWARFRSAPGASRPEWTGESELRGARIRVEGLAEPVEIESAAVKLSARGVEISHVEGSAGEVAFTGSYRWRPGDARPHTFSLAVGEIDAAALERLFEPALVRQRGFLSRTLRLGSSSPAPAWLRARRLEGSVAAALLKAGDWTARDLKAHVRWDGASVRLAELSGLLEAAYVSGNLEIDLAGPEPKYRFDGELTGVPYSGGRLDLMGVLDAEGPAARWTETARAFGSLHGRSIEFAPEAEFREVTACFQAQASPAGPRWQFFDIEAEQGGVTLTGSGATQSDGRLWLELTQGDRQVRYSGPILAAAPVKP